MSGSDRVSRLFSNRKRVALDMEQLDKLPFRMIPINIIVPDPDQPRKNFNEESLQELTESIKARGVLQPIRVVPYQEGYMIVAGERRWRAARMAELTEIPACIGDKDNKNDRLIDALVENIIRDDLSAVEKARAVADIQEMNPKMSDSELARRIGISRTMLYRLLNITKLPEIIQEEFYKHKLSDRHAKALLNLNCKPGLQNELFDTIVEKKLSGENAIELSKEWLVSLDENMPKKTVMSGFYNSFMNKTEKIGKRLSKVKPNDKLVIRRQIIEMRQMLEDLENKLKEGEGN